MKKLKFYAGNPTKATLNRFTINCTGDCVVGDVVIFARAVFTGTYPKSRYLCDESMIAEILADSYGSQKQQHTFTIHVLWTDYDKANIGSEIRIKGRNLYRNGTLRIAWADESKRDVILCDKHERGTEARKEREVRKSVQESREMLW